MLKRGILRKGERPLSMSRGTIALDWNVRAERKNPATHTICRKRPAPAALLRFPCCGHLAPKQRCNSFLMQALIPDTISYCVQSRGSVEAAKRRRVFMYRLFALCLCMFALPAFAADAMGTWKLNTTKSKYTGMPMPKDLTVTYTPEGGGWRYHAKGVSATGEPIDGHFNYTKDGEDIKTTGFPNWDTLVLRNARSNQSSGTLKRDGKPVGTVSRTISEDGKTMTIRGKFTTPEGKQATYLSVYDKQ
jgi:hypothetical protein